MQYVKTKVREWSLEMRLYIVCWLLPTHSSDALASFPGSTQQLCFAPCTASDKNWGGGLGTRPGKEASDALPALSPRSSSFSPLSSILLRFSFMTPLTLSTSDRRLLMVLNCKYSSEMPRLLHDLYLSLYQIHSIK